MKLLAILSSSPNAYYKGYYLKRAHIIYEESVSFLDVQWPTVAYTDIKKPINTDHLLIPYVCVRNVQTCWEF